MNITGQLFAVLTKRFADSLRERDSTRQLDEYLAAGIALQDAENARLRAEIERLEGELQRRREAHRKTWRQLDQALAAPVPAGWKMVPLDPTDSMLLAAVSDDLGAKGLRRLLAGDNYRAMVTAAPGYIEVQA